MRVLVTGGAGFIGSHTIDRLVAADHAVTVLDNLDPQVHGEAPAPVLIQPHVDGGRVRFIRGDVCDPDAVREGLGSAEVVVHLAAAVGVGQSMYQPSYYTTVNVAGTGVLLEAMARNPRRFTRLVVASSMSIYGEGEYECSIDGSVDAAPRPEAQMADGRWELVCQTCGSTLKSVQTRESKPLQPTSIYAITKKTQEELALCFGETYGIPTVALRFFNVFGSRQALSNPYTGVAAIFLARLRSGKPPLIFEDGRQSRDFIHVSDVARAVMLSATAPDVISGPYNVCTGRAVTIREVGEVLAARLGLSIEPEALGRFRAGDIRHCVGDPTKASESLGFRAHTGFEEGLDELLEWSERQSPVDRVESSFAALEKQGLVR